jgi:hypothetical protein
MRLPLWPIQPFWFSMANPYCAPSPSAGAGKNWSRSRFMAGEISLPRAKSRAHTRMSSSVEIMLPDAQPQDGFQSVASTTLPSGSLK